MPKDNLLSSINATFAGLREKGLYTGRDPMSIEAQIAQAELQEHQTRNQQIIDHFDELEAKGLYKLPGSENTEANHIATRLADLADTAPETPHDPNMLDTTP